MTLVGVSKFQPLERVRAAIDKDAQPELVFEEIGEAGSFAPHHQPLSPATPV